MSARRRTAAEVEAHTNGDCFVVAAFLADVSTEPGTRLVHGEVVADGGPHEGLTHWHAWVEYDVLVPAWDGSDRSLAMRRAVDLSNGGNHNWPASYYRQRGGVGEEGRRVREYTPDEARWQMVETGQFGPWEAS